MRTRRRSNSPACSRLRLAASWRRRHIGKLATASGGTDEPSSVKLKGPGSPRISPISQTRDREFESVSLQRGVRCELTSGGRLFRSHNPDNSRPVIVKSTTAAHTLAEASSAVAQIGDLCGAEGAGVSPSRACPSDRYALRRVGEIADASRVRRRISECSVSALQGRRRHRPRSRRGKPPPTARK